MLNQWPHISLRGGPRIVNSTKRASLLALLHPASLHPGREAVQPKATLPDSHAVGIIKGAEMTPLQSHFWLILLFCNPACCFGLRGRVVGRLLLPCLTLLLLVAGFKLLFVGSFLYVSPKNHPCKCCFPVSSPC